MGKGNVAKFAAHYQAMDAWEIADLHARADSLTEEARVALDSVIASRNIDLVKIRDENLKERTIAAANERTRQEKSEKRDAFLYKIFLFVGVPLTLIGAVFRPEKSYETLISTLVQVVGLVIIAWATLAVRRALSRRKK